MRFQEFKDKIIDEGHEVIDLMELVHHVLSKDASRINNSGMDEQLSFLLTRMSQDEIIKYLKRLED